MLTLVVTGPAGSERTTVDTAGRSVCAGGVTLAHVRDVEGRCVIVDSHDAVLNGWPMRLPAVLRPGDRLDIGDLAITVEGDAVGGGGADAEARLLAGIANGDATARLVYADHLEQSGEHARAEFLRLHDAIADGITAPDDARDRLVELARSIAARWRMTLGRPRIPCDSPGCPGDWGALRATEFEAVRTCETCMRPVYYCDRHEEARAHLHRGDLVVVDPMVDAPRITARAWAAVESPPDDEPITWTGHRGCGDDPRVDD